MTNIIIKYSKKIVVMFRKKVKNHFIAYLTVLTLLPLSAWAIPRNDLDLSFDKPFYSKGSTPKLVAHAVIYKGGSEPCMLSTANRPDLVPTFLQTSDTLGGSDIHFSHLLSTYPICKPEQEAIIVALAESFVEEPVQVALLSLISEAGKRIGVYGLACALGAAVGFVGSVGIQGVIDEEGDEAVVAGIAAGAAGIITAAMVAAASGTGGGVISATPLVCEAGVVYLFGDIFSWW